MHWPIGKRIVRFKDISIMTATPWIVAALTAAIAAAQPAAAPKAPPWNSVPPVLVTAVMIAEPACSNSAL